MFNNFKTFLGFREYSDKYTPIGYSEVEEIEGLISGMGEDPTPYLEDWSKLLDFVALLGDPIEEYTTDELLTVLADDEGGIDAVYAPAIFRGVDDNDGQLFLKVGANLFPMSQLPTSNELAVGSMKGQLKFTAVKKPNSEVVSHYNIECALRAKGSKEIFYIPAITRGTQKDSPITEGEILAAFESGENIAHFFDPVPGGGGGNAISMNDLEIGEYLTLEIKENAEHPQYGRSWMIRLAGGIMFFSKGRSFTEDLIKNIPLYEKRLTKGHPLTLKVSSKKVTDNGTTVNARFLFREPNAGAIAAAPVQAQLMPAQPALPATSNAIPAKTEQLEAIPF